MFGNVILKGKYINEPNNEHQSNIVDKYFVQCCDANMLLILTSNNIIKLYNISYFSFCAPDNYLLLTQCDNTGFYNIQTQTLTQFPNGYKCVMKISNNQFILQNQTQYYLFVYA